VRDLFSDMDEPSAAELAAIVAECPLIAAELDWLDAEITMLNADERGGPSPLDWRRLRRAEARVIRESFTYVARNISHPQPLRAA
jgi:hypothetical protein